MKLLIKKLHKDVRLPEKATIGAAAFDLYIPEDVVVKTGRNIIPSGIAIELEQDYEAKILPRSGFSAKGMEGYLFIQDFNGHIAVNGTEQRFDADVIVGTIDRDYRGEVGVIIKNCDMPFLMKRGTRVAQMVIYELPKVTVEVVDELSKSERGEGGFGSTGVN